MLVKISSSPFTLTLILYFESIASSLVAPSFRVFQSFLFFISFKISSHYAEISVLGMELRWLLKKSWTEFPVSTVWPEPPLRDFLPLFDFLTPRNLIYTSGYSGSFCIYILENSFSRSFLVAGFKSLRRPKYSLPITWYKL